MQAISFIWFQSGRMKLAAARISMDFCSRFANRCVADHMVSITDLSIPEFTQCPRRGKNSSWRFENDVFSAIVRAIKLYPGRLRSSTVTGSTNGLLSTIDFVVLAASVAGV